MKHLRDQFRHQVMQRGFTLMEVLIGIAIFAIGMLALASLQGALTRSTAEAKVRTTAVNIAEQVIEGQRGFAELTTTVGAYAFEDIIDATTYFDGEMTRYATPPGDSAVGVTYIVTQDVTDYYYDLNSDAFTETAPLGATLADFKTVVVNVAWNDNRDFVIDESTQVSDLGDGFIDVSATISKISVVTALQVSEQDDDGIIAPKIVYTPGENPDIVSLGLGDNKFKESLTPEPKVYRDNLETRFDVITYSAGGGDAVFLRREEFVAVSCECTLNAADGDNPGNSPVVWAGDEYTEPEFLTKAYGTPVSNTAQSNLCDACCRDHHDGGGSALYDPSRPDTGPDNEYSGGNHKHYRRQGPNLVEAGVGEDYLEACRLVRKDGFFRVAQDFRLEGLNTFAGDYLVNTSQVNDYSAFVIGEVYVKDDLDTYVPAAIDIGDGYQLDADPPTVDSAPRTALGDTVAGGDLTLGYTYLPTSTSAEFQQLRSRSIYIDNMSSDLRAVISCIEGKSDTELNADPGICDQGDVELDKTGSFNILELLPFFEVQTTYLNDWKKENLSGPEFTLTNEAVKSSDGSVPAHSRGLATNEPPEGTDMVHVFANRGVAGLSSSDPISNYNIDYVLPTLDPDPNWPPGDIQMIANADSPPPVGGRVITGTLSSDVPGVKAANVIVTATNAACNFTTTSGLFTCFIPTSLDTVTLTLSGFDKPPKVIYVCSSHQLGQDGFPAELPVDNPAQARDPKDVDLTNALSAPSPAYSLWLTLDASCS